MRLNIPYFNIKEKVSGIFQDFVNSEKNSGIVLIVCTLLSLVIANSLWADSYIDFWHQYVSISFLDFNVSYSIEHWVNDGLMAVFFLLVGLEIKRELFEGELYPLKNAVVPVIAAIGGMIFPAMIYIFFNFNLPTAKGFGIPMATDIAFSLAILSLVARKVPVSLKVLLTALAIIDDLGSILVIAFFYGQSIQWLNLIIALSIFLVLLLLNKLKINRITPYMIMGVVMWYFMMKSGIHTTLSGVLLAFTIPFRSGEKNPSVKLQEVLHIPVAFIILPIFTLVNTAIPLSAEYINNLWSPHALGIFFGLFLGKPIGISLSILISKKIFHLKNDVGWKKIWAMGMSAGIGFTMSIFIAHLAFNTEVLIQSSKMMILIASFISGITAYFLFMLSKDVEG